MWNRRVFVQRSASLAVLASASLGFTGCPSTATVAVFVSTIAKYAAQLAAYFGTSTLAGQILTLADTIAADIAAWQKGDSASGAVEALDDLADLVDEIPIAAPYAPFIDLLLGAIAGLLALLPVSKDALLTAARIHAAKLKELKIVRKSVPPIPYADFSKASMTAANDAFCAAWARLERQIGPVTK